MWIECLKRTVDDDGIIHKGRGQNVVVSLCVLFNIHAVVKFKTR